MALGASAAQAGFVVTSIRQPGLGPDGFDIVKFQARNDGIGGSGTRLLATDMTVSILGDGNFKFEFADIDADGVPDATAAGQTAPTVEPASPQFSFVKIYPGTWNIASVPPGSRSDPNEDGVPDANPPATFASTKSFRVAGFVSPPGALASTIPRTFAVAVVSPGSTVEVRGELASEVQGFSQQVVATDPIPEPATVGLLGVGAMSLLGRRRRA